MKYTAEEYRKKQRLARRDEQALWNVGANYEIAAVAAAASGWMRGEKDAQRPGKFISTVTGPGEDGGLQDHWGRTPKSSRNRRP